MTSDPPNRRVYERFDLLAQIRVREGGVDHVLEIINLSQGGALVDLGSEPCPRWLQLSRELEVRVFGADGEGVLEVNAKVVRIVETLDTRTFAVEFDAAQDLEIVRRVLRAAGKPPPLPTVAS